MIDVSCAGAREASCPRAEEVASWRSSAATRAVEDAAIAWVMERPERRAGRSPRDTRHRGAPADIESSGRLIEVKAFMRSTRGRPLARAKPARGGAPQPGLLALRGRERPPGRPRTFHAQGAWRRAARAPPRALAPLLRRAPSVLSRAGDRTSVRPRSLTHRGAARAGAPWGGARRWAWPASSRSLSTRAG